MTCPLRALALFAALAFGLSSFSPIAAAQAPSTPSPNSETFAVEVTLTAKTIIYIKGNSTWDAAFETLQDAFKSLNSYLDKQGIKASGPAMTIYVSADDTGFSFQAAVPIAEEPKEPPKGDISIGKSPAGKALRFIHRGSYGSMDSTYEGITTYLDDKQIEAQDVFVEEYQNDFLNTPEDSLLVHVYVPIK